MPSQLKLYVGCSLTQAPAEFVVSVETLKTQLREHYEVLDFLGVVNGTATEVYRWDIQRNIATCDLFLAICDYPALGLGYELAAAIEKYHKPVLAVAHTQSVVSRLILGIEAPNYQFKRYEQLGDVASLVGTKLASRLSGLRLALEL